MEERAQLLLKALVERYIADGQPVGSRTLAKATGLDLSPATIRNVMSDLEDLGLIASPHTSAGRVPTARGYRLFVDTMLSVSRRELLQEDWVQESAVPRDAQPLQVINHAAQLLSSLSHFVGVVVVPKRNVGFRHIEFLLLSERRVLMILVSPEGEVQNRVIHTPAYYQQTELTEAANYLNAHYAGLTMDEVRQRLQQEMRALRADIAALMQAAVAEQDSPEASGSEVVVSGERNLFSVSEFSADMNNLRRMFDLFEQKAQLARLLESSHRADGVRIFIGGESPLAEAYEDISVVSAPYEVGGEVVGALGVIGPTRMPYDRMIHIVDITAKMVSQALNPPRPSA
ncbi:MAG: Heat-inducible transcription repressor HrcA [Pseudomonadota bacterium]